MTQRRGEGRLAPLYDIASALAYDDHVAKVKLGMKVGRYYRVQAIGASAWDAFSDAAADPAVVALKSKLPARLVDAIAARAATCVQSLRAPATFRRPG